MWQLHNLTIQGGPFLWRRGSVCDDFNLASGSFNQSSPFLGVDANFTLGAGPLIQSVRWSCYISTVTGTTYTDNTAAKQM